MTDILERIASRIDLTLALDPPEMRSHPRISLREVSLSGERAIELLVDIGPETMATPRQALQWPTAIGAGAIALVKHRYVVRMCVAIAQVETAPWAELVRYARALATSIATSFSTSRRDADVSGLSHYGG